MLLSRLGTSLMEKILVHKGVISDIRGEISWSGFPILPHLLPSFTIQRYSQKESRFNGVC